MAMTYFGQHKYLDGLRLIYGRQQTTYGLSQHRPALIVVIAVQNVATLDAAQSPQRLYTVSAERPQFWQMTEHIGNSKSASTRRRSVVSGTVCSQRLDVRLSQSFDPSRFLQPVAI